MGKRVSKRSRSVNAPARTLTDLPDACMEVVLADLAPVDFTPLFRSCRGMRDAVLAQRRVFLDIDLSAMPKRGKAAAVRAKLLLGCKYATRMGLCCTFGPSDVDIMSAAAAAVGPGLAAINSVRLVGLHYGLLLPPWLADCTNLSAVTLTDSTLQSSSDPGCPMRECPQIKSLELGHAASIPTDQRTIARAQRQLHALTGLAGLTINDAQPLAALQCLSVLSSQLTKLHLRIGNSCTGQLQPVLSQLSASFPGIPSVQLDLPVSTLCDEDMEALLSCPELTGVECYEFNLEEDYSKRSSNWTHIGTSNVYVDAWGRLPLDSVRSIRIKGDWVFPSTDLSTNVRVAEAVSKCSVDWVGRQMMLLANHGIVDMACLVAAMPILATCQLTTLNILSVTPVTSELLNTIAQQFAGHKLKHVFFGSCTWAPGVWPLVLSSLPPAVVYLCLGRVANQSIGRARGGVHEMTEADAIDMCVHACRPVTVRILRVKKWKKGWEKRVKAAMAKAGHQHVQLTLK